MVDAVPQNNDDVTGDVWKKSDYVTAPKGYNAASGTQPSPEQLAEQSPEAIQKLQAYVQQQYDAAVSDIQAHPEKYQRENVEAARAKLEAEFQAGNVLQEQYQQLDAQVGLAENMVLLKEELERTPDIREKLEAAKNASLGLGSAEDVARMENLVNQPSANPMASEQAQEAARLNAETSELYAQRERALQEYESIKGHQGKKAAAMGAAGAGTIAYGLHQMFNAGPKLKTFLEQVKHAAIDEHGEVLGDKVKEQVGDLFKKLTDESVKDADLSSLRIYLSEGRGSLSDLKTAVSNSISEFLRGQQAHSIEGIGRQIRQTLVDAGIPPDTDGLSTVVDALKGHVAKAATGKHPAAVEEAIGKVIQDQKVIKILTDNAAISSTLNGTLDSLKDTLTNIATEAHLFEKSDELKGVRDAVQENIIQTGFLGTGKFFGGIAQKFNQLGDSTNKIIDIGLMPTNGKLKQTAVITGIVAGTALFAYGVDRVIKSGNEQKRNNIKDEVGTMNVRIEQNDGRIAELERALTA